MTRTHRALQFSGIIAAAIASVATSPPLSSKRQIFEDSYTLTPEMPVAILHFKVRAKSDEGSPSLSFSFARSDSEYQKQDDPTRDCVSYTWTDSTNGNVNTNGVRCVPKGTALPGVLLQIREAKSPEIAFGAAVPVDYGESPSRQGAPSVCYEIGADGTSLIRSTKCTTNPGRSSCDGENSCERTFEVRLLLQDRNSGPKTVKYRAEIVAQTTESNDKSISVELQRAP
jgi:hypothetical protein